ncbi:hypothetical protein QTG54_002871 [Skeletonema marinoi]|uniref:Uncharacterized protein n=1 Tax=Skeletonema marinoi TaxID=267567 RepID=A0AAD9DHH5_9STRA|nr:hypothetical protein QTG54_002871 [Skeletonema marinoi]
MKAGKMALDGCDHKTAYSYLGVALSLLPNDHWSSHYDLSLRLYFLKSSAANSICQYYEAELFLRMTLEKARCLDDQLPSYLLLSQILQAQGNVNDVYDSCSTVLTELGESIPVTYTLSESSEMLEETLKMYEEVGDKWLKGEKTVDKTLQTTLQFYNVIVLASYFCKSYSMVAYFTCKAMQLSLQRGLCDHTPLALIQFTTVLNKDENAMLCYRIAKDAMSLRERFDVAAQIPELYFNFYGRIAWRFEPFQAGIDKLRQGFEAGLSSGHADMGLHCAIQVIKTTILSGANLSSILKEIDYYLHLLKTKSEVTRNFLRVFRKTVSLLIDNGEATSTAADPCIGVGDLNDQNRKLRDAVLQHSVIRCYWSGHNERCRNFGEKCKHLFGQGRQSTSYIAQFFFGKLQL